MTSTSATSRERKIHPAWLVLILWLVFIVALLAVTGVKPRYIKIHEGKHWIWYAPESVWNMNKDRISRFFDYADAVYEALRENLGVEPKGNVYILVHPGGGGFAVGDIAEIRALTGQRSPGIGIVYDAFTGA